MDSRLSPAQSAALSKIAAGKRASDGFRSQSEYGGLTGTLLSLRRRGLLDIHDAITPAGRAALAAQEDRS